jgi:hypothetical protein
MANKPAEISGKYAGIVYPPVSKTERVSIKSYMEKMK